MSSDEPDELREKLGSKFLELQNVFGKIEAMREDESEFIQSIAEGIESSKSDEWVKRDDETVEEYAQRWQMLHQERKQKAVHSIDKLNTYLEMLRSGALNRNVGTNESGSEEEIIALTENFDEAFQKIIADCRNLLEVVGGYFDWESENVEWTGENDDIFDEMAMEIDSIDSLLYRNKFFSTMDGNFTKLRDYAGGTELNRQPQIYTFIKNVLSHSLLSVYGALNAFFVYVMDLNKITDLDDILDKKPPAETVSQGGLVFVKIASALTSFEYSMSPEESAEVNDIIQNLVYSMQGYTKMLEKIPIGEGKYTPLLSNVNSHMITNKYRPRETYANLGMWPLERETEYRALFDLDMNNWLGSEWHRESISCSGPEHRILYRDFIDFIQSIGYSFLKVSAYNEHRRMQPKLSVFKWGREMRKYRPDAVIFFHNPHCQVAGKEMRIAIRSRNFGKSGEIECIAGLDLLKSKNAAESIEVESELLLREDTENFVRKLIQNFNAYQMEHGLLKNAKFDAMMNELNVKGRTFDDMILSDSKKQLLDDNIFAILSNSERLIERGVETNRGIMLAGPPGVGKSMTIDAIISDASCTVMYANFLMLRSNMEGIFETARRYAPTILILEDIDALGITGQRGVSGSGAGLSTLLNCMDGINSNNGVITVATSNHPEQMDWALIARPGRFDVRIDYPYPNRELLQGILKLKLSSYPCENDLDLDGLVKDMPLGFTGSHIHDIVNQANYISINNSEASAVDVKISNQALHSAIERSRYNFNKFLDERPHINLQNPPSAAEILHGDKEKNDYFG